MWKSIAPDEQMENMYAVPEPKRCYSLDVTLFVHIMFRVMNYSSGLMTPIDDYFLNSLMEIQTGEKNRTPMLWSKSSINPVCWFLLASWGGKKQVLDGEVVICISCMKWSEEMLLFIHAETLLLFIPDQESIPVLLVSSYIRCLISVCLLGLL